MKTKDLKDSRFDAIVVIANTVFTTLFGLLFIASLVAVLMDYRAHLLTALASLIIMWLCAKDTIKEVRRKEKKEQDKL